MRRVEEWLKKRGFKSKAIKGGKRWTRKDEVGGVDVVDLLVSKDDPRWVNWAHAYVPSRKIDFDASGNDPVRDAIYALRGFV